MSDDDLRELCSDATPGPWIVVGAGRFDYTIDRDNGNGTGRILFERQATVGDDAMSDKYLADGEFICAAREAVPELLDRVAALEAKVREQEDWLGRFANDSEAYRMGEEAGLAIRSLANQQHAEALAAKIVTMSEHQSYGTVVYRVSICGEVINGISDRSAADHHLSRLRWKIAQLLAQEMEGKE